MTRKSIVGLVHEFLRSELQEPEEIDSSPAYVLQDLFDCRVCAGHIIQIYVKGIMDEVVLPDGRLIFNGEKEVSKEELSDIITKTCFPEFRTPRRTEKKNYSSAGEPEEISLEQVKQLMKEEKRPLLVDVRTEREYAEGSLPGAVNLPLLSIIKNPFVLSENRDKTIVLFCKEGYQSKTAARCLLEAGYKKVAYLQEQGKMVEYLSGFLTERKTKAQEG
ncbi:MAG: rhodanese-like domain-containing protein [Lachnospiraceae bacterium]|nr:rhodanese-like domain-containing protein [Lachnospiraceae bacterium]MBP3579090.1 rhodanese-like domain-containing protein [Lachnospiraceae bacterium]